MYVVKATDDLQILVFVFNSGEETMNVLEFIERQRVFKFNDPLQRNIGLEFTKNRF